MKKCHDLRDETRKCLNKTQAEIESMEDRNDKFSRTIHFVKDIEGFKSNNVLLAVYDYKKLDALQH